MKNTISFNFNIDELNLILESLNNYNLKIHKSNPDKSVDIDYLCDKINDKYFEDTNTISSRE